MPPKTQALLEPETEHSVPEPNPPETEMTPRDPVPPGGTAPRADGRSNPFFSLLKLLAIAIPLYAFLVSVKLMGEGFEMFGTGFAENLIATTSNPFVGLFIGILATSIVQSSSTTTSMTVGFVAAGILSIENAVPIIMGANIGTTVTCAIVSLGHISRGEEFRRAFAAASVHDFFNVLAVLVLFPLELATGFLSKSARALSGLLAGGEAITFASPVKKVVSPAVDAIIRGVEASVGGHAAVVAVLGFVLLLVSLYFLVRATKRLALARAEIAIDRLMGKSGLTGMAVGAGVTAVIQSSSVTTSLLVPFAGAGIMRLEKIFPITLGANIGTTVTALLASLAGNADGLTIALVHLLFNVTGILLIYPFRPVRRIPIIMARRLADAAVRSKKTVAFFVIGLFYAVPGLMILLDRIL
jgi:sodium-dependent phosphate cotransporter